MRTAVKVVLIIVTLLVGTLLIGLTKEMTGTSSSKGNGPFGLIIGFGMIGAITAIWRYNPDKNEKKDLERKDPHTLNKD